MRTPPTLIRLLGVLLGLALLTAACGGSGAADAFGDGTVTTSSVAADPDTTTTTIAPEVPLEGLSPTDYAAFRAQPTACGAEAPPPATEMSFPAPEDLGLDPAKLIEVTLTTSCGEIVLELDPGLAPETVNSFVFLAEQGYFDGTAVHRVLPGFVVQAGDPTATGLGNPGYTVPDEYPPPGFLYTKGVVAMANAGAGTTGSQFFIMLGDAALPPNYTYFGNLVAGSDTLDRIAAVPLGASARGEPSVPLQTVYLDRVAVETP